MEYLYQHSNRRVYPEEGYQKGVHKGSKNRLKSKRNAASNYLMDCLPVCPQGDFEGGNPGMTYYHAIAPTYPTPEWGINTTGNPQFSSSNESSYNDFGAAASRVTAGAVPWLSNYGISLDKVADGNKALRMNPFDCGFRHNTNDVTYSRRCFVLDPQSPYFSFKFSLIFEYDGNVPMNKRPFFRIRILDENNNILKEKLIKDDSSQCFFHYKNIQVSPDDCPNGGISTTENKKLLYTGWVYTQFDLSQYVGVYNFLGFEFTIADGSSGMLSGMVYIDDICDEEPPPVGQISLTSADFNCATKTVTVCGHYNTDLQNAHLSANDIALSFTDNQNNTTNVTVLPTTDPQNGTFCFEIPYEAFGNNPFGDNYQFQVNAQYTMDCIIGDAQTPAPVSDSLTANFPACILAVDDTIQVSACHYGPNSFYYNVLVNDSINGESIAPPGNEIILTTITNPAPGINLNLATGELTFDNNLQPGSYTFTYQICSLFDQDNCDQATVIITVTPPELIAHNDDFTNNAIDFCQGGLSNPVWGNDTYCGMPLSFFGTGNLSYSLIDNGGLTGATINSSGKIDVSPNSSEGVYTLTYVICKGANPAVCDTAEVKIKIAKIQPVFDVSTTICKGISAPDLPQTSENGITGTWSPATISNQQSGDYIFTPNDNCAAKDTVHITVLQECGLFLNWDASVNCQQADDRIKPFNADIVDEGPCLKFCENSTVTFTITGNVNNIDHTDWNVSGGTMTGQTNTSCTIDWGSQAYSFIDITVTMTDGVVKHLHVCVEKLPEPTANFKVHNQPGDAIIVCKGATVNFENLSHSNGGSDVLYYHWVFGDDGSSSSAFEPSHTFNTIGAFDVQLQVTTGCSCTDKTTRKVIVKAPLPAIECIGVVCEGESAKYTLPLDPHRYDPERCPVQWKVEGGHIVSQDPHYPPSVTVVWDDPNPDGFGYLTAGLKCMPCKTTAKIPVVSQEGTIKGDDRLCPHSQAIFSLPQWPTTDFQWQIMTSTGATLIKNNQRNQIVLQTGQPGTFTLTCHYHNTLLGCSGTATKQITVKPPLQLDRPDTVCQGVNENFTFVNPYGTPIPSPVHYTILGPGGFSQSGNGTGFTVAFPQAGTYNVTVNSSAYCVDGFLSIPVTGRPNAPQNIEGDTLICPGVPVSFSTNVPNGYTAHWMVENGSILGAPVGENVSASFAPNATGPYKIKLYYENGGCPSDTLALTLAPNPPDLTFTTASDTVCGSSYAVYSLADTVAETYTWSILPQTAGSVTSGQNTNSVTILWNDGPQNATVKVKARKCGTYSTQTHAVHVMGTPAIALTGDNEACVGHPAHFHVEVLDGSGQFSSIDWNMGDGTDTTTYGANLDYTYTMPLSQSTTYTVTATVNDPSGCPQPAGNTFDIVVSPSPVVTLTPTYVNLCNGLDHSIAVNIQGGFSPTITVDWYKNGNYLTTGHSIDADDPNYGPGSYYAIVTNAFDCTQQTQTVMVTGDCGTEEQGCPGLSIQTAAQITGCQEVTLAITGTGGPATNTWFSGLNNLGGTVSTNPNGDKVVSGLEPGHYTVLTHASYASNGDLCQAYTPVQFTIPYKAGIKYHVSCAPNGGYTIQVLDHSVFYPDPNITYQYRLSVVPAGNPPNWQNGTVVSGIHQLTVQRPPGSYTLGVKIYANGLPPCKAFTTLTLSGAPTANFTIGNTDCPNEAVQFTAGDTGPGLTYLWTFNYNITNSQQNPVKTFDPGTQNTITLTVTNQYGCSASQSQSINIPTSQLDGQLKAHPDVVCEGQAVTIHFDPGNNQTMPETFQWYHNNGVYIGTTNSPSLTVTEGGQYYVFVTGPNGCHNYDTHRKVISVIPSPSAPDISGPGVVCTQDTFNLSVPDIEGMHYHWALNGTPLPPSGGDPTTISMHHDQPGVYDYSVTASYEGANGLTCTGPAGHFTVNVIPPPEKPQLFIDVLKCHPYRVEVSVTNAQPSVTYHWSNGDTGASTLMGHDGPLQVIADNGACTAKTQVDLPVDLAALTWIFPQGCYASCLRKDMGDIIGPYGEFAQWQWLQDQQALLTGSGTVSPLSVYPTHTYGLTLDNGYCHLTIDGMHLSVDHCQPCNQIVPTLLNTGCQPGYQGFIHTFTVSFTNNTGTTVFVQSSIPSSVGHFTGTPYFPLPPGTSTHTFHCLITQAMPPTGLNVPVTIEAHWEGHTCQSSFVVHVPSCLIGTENQDASKNGPSLIVSPNPTGNHASKATYQTGSKEGHYKITLRDLYGRVLKYWKTAPGKGRVFIDCTGLLSGTYFVCLQRGNSILCTQRLILK